MRAHHFSDLAWRLLRGMKMAAYQRAYQDSDSLLTEWLKQLHVRCAAIDSGCWQRWHVRHYEEAKSM